MKLTMAVLALGVAGTVAAQNPPPAPPGGRPAPGDTMAPRPGMPMMGPGQMDPEQAQQLRQQVEERFGRMVQTELQLNDQQMDRLRQAMRANQDRRRDLVRREMDIRRAIGEQLQPGVAANQDSLNRLLSAAAQTRTQHAQSQELFLRDLSFMTPVQRARFLQMAERFEQRMMEVRQRFQPGEGRPMGPGMAPGGRRPGMMGRPRDMPMGPGGQRPGGAGGGPAPAAGRPQRPF